MDHPLAGRKLLYGMAVDGLLARDEGDCLGKAQSSGSVI
jgi:hypothetical protein